MDHNPLVLRTQKEGEMRQVSLENTVELGRLVDLIQNKPAIWDTGSAEYSNNIQKSRAWESVCLYFFPDYHRRSAATKKKMMNIVKTKWKSLRDRFKKDLKVHRGSKSGQAPSKYKFHPMFESLMFLVPSLQTRATSGNMGSVRREEEEHDSQSSVQPEDSFSGQSASESLRDVGVEEQSESSSVYQDHGDDCLSPLAITPPPSSPVSVAARAPVNPPKRSRGAAKKTTDSNNEEVLKMIKEVSTCVENAMRPKDDISYFMQSLELDVRKVPKHNLGKLKIDFLKIVDLYLQPDVPLQRQPDTQQYAPPLNQSLASNQNPIANYSAMYPFTTSSSQTPFSYNNYPGHCIPYMQPTLANTSRSQRGPTQTSPVDFGTAEALGSSLQMLSRSSTPIIEDV
ncbi:uncharacterized protein [Hyperolius riggenbachi]|uniref:uncharacterized protein n=1 Tax=Hyperolius riggenbachi TaxID=752182 RepID=UPI0035A28C9D